VPALLKSFYDDYSDWLAEQGVDTYQLRLDVEDETISVTNLESAFEVSLFFGDIDEEFYGEDKALTVEFPIKTVSGGEDLDPYIVDLADSCVFSRIRVRLDEGGTRTLLLEASLPESMCDLSLCHMMIREVLTLAESAPT
jgi:hypothetical protein